MFIQTIQLLIQKKQKSFEFDQTKKTMEQPKSSFQNFQVKFDLQTFPQSMKAILLLFCLIFFATQSSDFKNCCDLNQIDVNGNSQIQLKPDIAIVTITIENSARTSSFALQGLNTKINRAINIIKNQGINQQDYFTQRISIRPQYDFQNGVSTLVAQIASQSIVVTVRGFDITGSTIGRLIDSVIGIDGIRIDGVSFDREDKANANRQARKAAFEDALSKANQYAVLANKKLQKLLSIVDSDQRSFFPVFKSLGNAISADTSTVVPVQNVKVRASISAKWKI